MYFFHLQGLSVHSYFRKVYAHFLVLKFSVLNCYGDVLLKAASLEPDML